MKTNVLTQIILYVALVLTGMTIGIVLQRYVGLGNLLRTVGVAYPTRPPLSGSDRPAVMDIPREHQGRMRLFILAGQSNMVGWSPIPEGERTDPRIYVFGKDYHWRIAVHPVEDASNQVDLVSENLIAGFGPSIDFAFALIESQPEIVIGLIPCAKNSSGIIQWQRNLSDQSLYGSCLKRVRAASPMGEVAGILFFQGETDAADPIQYPDPPPRPSEWSDLFTAFITDMRNDLNQPNLPVVFAQIGSTWAPEAYPNWDFVMRQQASLQLHRSAMIITSDLPLQDGLHFTTESYRIIGSRFAKAYKDLVGWP